MLWGQELAVRMRNMSHSLPELNIVIALCTQAQASMVRNQLKSEEAEALARGKRQEGQQSGFWRDLMRRMQSQQTVPEDTALVTARDREQKVQEILGPPPEPPVAPKGDSNGLHVL